MVDNSVDILSQGGKEINYKSVRSKYFELCSQAFEKQSLITGPWTTDARQHIISCIKNNTGSSLYDLSAETLAKYQIVLEDGEEKLVLAGSATEVLPYEECFDILLDAHNVTNHGDFSAVKSMLMGRFLICDTCINIFVQNCNVCVSEQIREKPTTFNGSVIIEIEKMPVEDNACKYLLFYMDKGTTYKLFKPLLSEDEDDVAIELFKIFVDFGPPLNIETKHTKLIHRVLSILGKAGIQYNIPIYELNPPTNECSILIDYILKQNEPTGDHWSTTSRFVQRDHNRNVIPGYVLHRYMPILSPISQLFSITHKDYNKLAHTECVEECAAKEKTNSDSDNEEINQTMDTGEEYCADCEPGTSKVNDPTSFNYTDKDVKQEITVEETVIMNKNHKTDSSQIGSVQIHETTKISKIKSDTAKLETAEGKKLCSYCKERMFTDYFCYGCKKPTHIFCLTRIQKLFGRENCAIETFLYCRPCSK